MHELFLHRRHYRVSFIMGIRHDIDDDDDDDDADDGIMSSIRVCSRGFIDPRVRIGILDPLSLDA